MLYFSSPFTSPLHLSTSAHTEHITLHSRKGTCSGAKDLSSIQAPHLQLDFQCLQVNSPTGPVTSSSKEKTISSSLGWAHPSSATSALLLLILSGLRKWTRWTHMYAWLIKGSPTPVLPWLSTLSSPGSPPPSSPAPPVCSFPIPSVIFHKTLSLSPSNPSLPLHPFYLPSRQLQSLLHPACQCSWFSKLTGHTALL